MGNSHQFSPEPLEEFSDEEWHAYLAQRQKITDEVARRIGTYHLRLDYQAYRKTGELAGKLMTLVAAVQRKKSFEASNAQIQDGIKRMKDEMHHFQGMFFGPNKIQYTRARSNFGNLFWDDEAAEQGQIMVEVLRQANIASRAMDQISKMLDFEQEKFPARRGRPSADEDGFVEALARLYAQYIEPPSSYAEGPFANLVRFALELADRPSQDPSRPIAAALRKITDEKS